MRTILAVLAVSILLPAVACAQGRPGALSPEQLACADIRRAHKNELIQAYRGSGAEVMVRCAGMERECGVALKSVYPGGCVGASEKACEDERAACRKGYQACATVRARKPLQREIMQDTFARGCVSLAEADCPLKVQGKRNEPQLCHQTPDDLTSEEDAALELLQ